MAITLISNESVIGTLTPNVYVSNITLEGTGETNLNDKNTSLISIHTAYTENVDDVKTASDAITVGEVLMQAAKEDMYANPASVAYSDSKLKVKVDMVVKESMGGLAEFWANNGDVNQYVNIVSGYSLNSLTTKILSLGSNLIRLAQPTSQSWWEIATSVEQLVKNNMLTDAEMSIVQSLLNNNSLTFGSTEFMTAIFQFITSSTENFSVTSLSEVMKNEMANYESTTVPYFETDAEGNKIKNYKFSRTSTLDSPKHLSFSVLSCLDLKKMADDFEIDFDMMSTPHGKLVYEQIIDNDKVNTKSFVYINPDTNNIWAGPVHVVVNEENQTQQWKTGFTETEASFPVVKTTIPNAKIQDFRVVERVEKINFDLSFLETQVFNRGMSTKHITRDKMDVIKQPAYFTPMHLARDASGNCRFMFGIDYHRLLVENTLFGKLFQSSLQSKMIQILAMRTNTKLINFKIKRRRVNKIKGATRLGGFDTIEVPFKTGYLGESHIDDEEIIETVAMGKDKAWDGPLASTEINLQENSLTFAKTNGFTNNTYGLRFFSGVDVQMPSITDGFYQYGVELEIIDNTIQHILLKIAVLYSNYQDLCFYYNDATTPTHYNEVSNRFNETFKNRWSQPTNIELKVGGTTIVVQPKPWEGAIANLIEVLNTFRPADQKIDQPSVIFALTMISNSTTGTPRGISTLRQLLLNTCSKLAKMAGTSLQEYSSPGKDYALDPASVATPKQAAYKTSVVDKRRIKIDYWFPNSFDSDVPKNVGYDYLSATNNMGGRPLTGLWTVNGTQYNNRFNAELMKYFSSTDFSDDKFSMSRYGLVQTPDMKVTSGDTPENTGYTFFSPSSINLGKPSYHAGGGPTSVLAMINIASILNAKKNSWSMLNGGGAPLDDYKTLSFISTKIMNYKLNGKLPSSDAMSNQNKDTFKAFSEIDDKIKFNLNQILANENCTAVLSTDKEEQASLANAIQANEYMDLSIGAVDPYESGLTPSDQELSPLNAGHAGTKENYLFLALAYYFAGKCTEGLTKGPTQSDFDISFFDTSERVDTILPFLEAKFSALGMAAGNNDLFIKDKINKTLKKLPNAIKSLLLSNKGNSKYNWGDMKSPTSNANYKGAFALNYQNIKKVEVLSGYEINDDGEILINAPKWVEMNKDIFDANTGKDMLCRLVSYKNETFGVEMQSCLELPVFHEYFILNPANQVVNPEPQPILSVLSTTGVPIPQLPNFFGSTGDMSDYSSTGVGISESVIISTSGGGNPPTSGGRPTR